jgi:hypothetical protein
MFGFDFIEFIIFLKQFGLALTGAASLWGLVFVWKKRYGRQAASRHIVLDWIGRKMLIPYFVGLFAVVASWILYELQIPAIAHEGIVIVPTAAERHLASSMTSMIYICWFAFSLLMSIYVIKRKDSMKPLVWFYGINLFVSFFLISLPAWTGELSFVQAFHAGHGFHSIFTVGTVVVLDFLFLLSFSSLILKQHIYPMFPAISKVIWVGLGFDFLSVALVFEEAIRFIPKFFFMQTVISILIINGILLSGILTRKLIWSISEGGENMNKKWENIANIAGTISVASWLSITFVDFFEDITLGYWNLIAIYLGLIILLNIGHAVWEKYNPLTHDELPTHSNI